MASGPSAKDKDLPSVERRCKVIAIKHNVELCPWADVVYGCDPAWWLHRQGLPSFAGLKVAWSGARLEYPDIRKVEIADGTSAKYSDRLHFEPGTIGGGGNSGFQALNLAVQWGARKILLVGFDMTDRANVHWYGRNQWPAANNPDQSNFKRWLAAFEGAAGQLRDIGVEVFNASTISALGCFPRLTIKQFLEL